MSILNNIKNFFKPNQQEERKPEVRKIESKIPEGFKVINRFQEVREDSLMKRYLNYCINTETLKVINDKSNFNNFMKWYLEKYNFQSVERKIGFKGRGYFQFNRKVLVKA